MSYGSMLHIPLTNSLNLTAKQKPYKKAYLITKNIPDFSGKSLEERASRQKKTERVTGLGRRTRQETAKRNQMTALRFQTGGRHQTSPDSLQGRTRININNLHILRCGLQFNCMSIGSVLFCVGVVPVISGLWGKTK